MALTLSQIMTLAFLGKHSYVSMGLDFDSAMLSYAKIQRITLKICIDYGASYAQLLAKKRLTGSGQVTEL